MALNIGAFRYVLELSFSSPIQYFFCPTGMWNFHFQKQEIFQGKK